MGDDQEFEKLTSTAVAKEVTNFRWKIKYFSGIYQTPPTVLSPMVFVVGERIGYPSKWKLEFLCSYPYYAPNIALSAVELAEGVKAGDMTCEARIKSRYKRKDFISVTFTTTSSTPKLTRDMHTFCKKALLTDNELVIYVKCMLTIKNVNKSSSSCSKKIPEESPRPPELPEPHGLCSELGNLLETGYNSDFEIQVKNCDGEMTKIKVHKTILGSRSPVFRKMFETQMTESATGQMLIEDLSAECINVMLKWIYSGILDEEWKKTPEEIVAAADKYDLPSFLNFLDKYLHVACTLENAIGLRKVARLYGLEDASKNVNKFIHENLERLTD